MYRPKIVALNYGWLVIVGVLLSVFSVGLADSPKKPDAALERTRKQVRMLDDIYKNAIVLITTHYVKDKKSLPAGRAFKKLFQAVKDKGWHEVRLLDATGEPINVNNEPQDAFEKKAVKALVNGNSYYEQVVTQKGKRYLRAATPIPVVMNKCIMCHSNYAGVPKNKPIGALGYKIPIE